MWASKNDTQISDVQQWVVTPTIWDNNHLYITTVQVGYFKEALPI